jgi:succinate dehydrogenase / fumarate reductase membrane anchor subunit
MATSRIVVGARYGLRDWLAQRVTGVVLLLYVVVLGCAIARAPELDYGSWAALFVPAWMKVATLVAVLALTWHAWVGVRDIFMDYIKPTWVRLSLQVGTIVLLIGYAFWAVLILWRV